MTRYQDHEVSLLVVEDDEIDFMAFQRKLKKSGLNNPLIRAADGQAALDILRQNEVKKPFIVFLDLNMPKMDGITFLDHIRSDADLKSTLIFVFTTSENDQDITKAHDRNIAGYILKGSLDDGVIPMLQHYIHVACLQA